jgi:small subunit ribosomal protein S4
MARDMTPVLKRCRSLGLEPALLGLSKKASKRTPRQVRKLSEYGLQLREKQKVKFIYGVLEKQFRNYYDKADHMPGITGENLLRMLEMRLDNVIFRMGYGRTRTDARQVVRHNHVIVNGKKVNIPSYQVSVGDKIEIREKSRGMDRFKNTLDVTGTRIAPEWLTADHEGLSGTIVSAPTREQIDLPVNETLIIELYSK